jgi:signal transduction histidine kinase
MFLSTCYVKGDKARSKHGSGVVVKKILELHGGDVHADQGNGMIIFETFPTPTNMEMKKMPEIGFSAS